MSGSAAPTAEPAPSLAGGKHNGFAETYRTLPEMSQAAFPRFCAWVFGIALILKAAAAAQVADLDMFHQMALFRFVLENGSFPEQDVFAYTPTVTPFVHHEWGTGALLYLVSVTAGLGATGVLLLRYALLAGTAAMACAAARRGSAAGPIMALAAGPAVAMLAIGLSTLRAQMFTFFFVAVLLYLLERDDRRPWPWLLWLALYIAWLNLHGGFVIGLALLGARLGERIIAEVRGGAAALPAIMAHRHLALIFLAMLVAPLLNPYGLEYFPYLWNALTMDRPLVAEWSPLWDPRVATAVRLAFLGSLLPLLYALWTLRTLRLPGLTILAITGCATLLSQRILPIYGIAWFVYIPGYLARTPFDSLVRRAAGGVRLSGGVVMLALGMFSIGQALTFRPWELRFPTTPEEDRLFYPAGAVAYLRDAAFEGNVMTPFAVGAFVSWKLYPAVKVGMDSRYEAAYPPEVAEENHALYRASTDWRRILARFPTDLVLVPTNEPLYGALKDSGAAHGWPLVYRDDGYALFARAELAALLPEVDRTGHTPRVSFP